MMRSASLATQFGQQIGREDIGVWVARMARVKGSAFYVETAYPRLPAAINGARMWSLAHGIARQESSFDRSAVSHAGARGMMQLMPGTAREQAGKMGLSYEPYRLTSDPAYNVMLGTAYFQRMLNIWDGNVPLAVASYNAGSGNAGKWVNRYGDPRGAQGRAAVDRADPVQRDQGLCAAGHREQRRLRPDEPELAERDGPRLPLPREEPSGLRTTQ